MQVSGKLREFFRQRVDTRPVRLPPDALRIRLPDDDSFDSPAISPAPPGDDFDDDLGYAEGQSFIIDYVDAEGRTSTRRITVWDIDRGAGGCPMLVATCHERRAKRHFRIDRIRAVYDFDGVVQEPLGEFLVETFGMSRRLVERRYDETEEAEGNGRVRMPFLLKSDDLWKRVRATCRRRGVPLLCLLARADRDLHPAELALIERYAVNCCREAAIELTEREVGKLNGYLSRLRPSEKAVSRCLDLASQWSSRDLMHLLETCAHVVKADGIVHPQEMEAFAFFVKELTGRELRE